MANEDVDEIERYGLPCGSDNTSPYSERATPPYMIWAKDLHYLLEDYEGMSLFEKFLRLTNSDNELRFWYACNGLKKLQTQEEIVRIAKSISKDFIHKQGKFSLNCISSTKRIETQQNFAEQKNIDKNIFDDVQKEVYDSLRIKHEDFVRSDTYVMYLQLQEAQAAEGVDSATYYCNDSPHSSSNSSSNSGDVLRPHSSLLATVQEEEAAELESSAGEKMSRYSDASTVCVREETAMDFSNEDNNVLPSSCNRKISPTRDRKRPALRENNNLNSSLTCGGGEKRKAPSGGGGGPSTSQKLTHSSLAKTLGQRMHSAIRPLDSSQPGLPPHPYHTTRPYVPYLTTSAQDSELQSMSSDAATESSVSANFRHSERLAMKYAKQNIANENFIPRTQRPADTAAQPQDMMHEEFRRQVFRKLDKISKEMKMQEKLSESLKSLAEPENNENSHRASVEKFSKVEKVPDNAEAILDEHCRALGWNDTPPLQSPSFGVFGRRKSPGSKSPDRRAISRVMTASYPVTMQASYLQQSTPYPPPNFGVGGRTSAAAVDQSPYNIHWNQNAAMQQSFSGSPRHRGTGASTQSPANTLQHRHNNNAKSSLDGQVVCFDDKQRGNNAVSTRSKCYPAPVLSDTSGFSSSTSTQVSTDPSMAGANVLPGARPKSKSTETHSVGAKQKAINHSSSSTVHKSSKVQKVNNSNPSADITAGLQQKLRNMKIDGGRRSIESSSTSSYVHAAAINAAATHNNFISVVYWLPNEPTPFRTKFSQAPQMTLKQFKGLLARRQGSFKYFFKQTYENSDVWEEILNDNDIVPFHGTNVVEARLEATE